MDENIKKNLRQGDTWKRGLYMLLFVIIYSIAEFVIAAVVLFQFLTVLFTGSTNAQVLAFGQSLSTYIYQIMRFMTFNSDVHPYPFGKWPEPAPPEPEAEAKTIEPGE